MMYYEKVLQELNARGIRYIVAGGIAVNLHGVPRATADLDLLLHMENSNVAKLTDAIKKLGYKPRAPVSFADITFENNRFLYNSISKSRRRIMEKFRSGKI